MNDSLNSPMDMYQQRKKTLLIVVQKNIFIESFSYIIESFEYYLTCTSLTKSDKGGQAMSESIEHIFYKFPEDIKGSLLKIPQSIKKNIEEIRVKAEGSLNIYASGKEFFLNQSGEFVSNGKGYKNISKATLVSIFNAVLNYSAYAYEEELANGYITIKGGHRVGVCGKTVINEGKIQTIKDISSLNIRRSKEIIGISDDYVQYILKDSKSIYNTLLVSPPKCGKTTLLRDIVRHLSSKGFKMGVVDERSEIAGMYEGIPQNNLGVRTDILDGCPKEKGIIMMIRSMSPDIIVTDEIGKAQDIYAVECVRNAGIQLITTIHGASYEDIIHSKIKPLIQQKVFERIFFLSNSPVTGHVQYILNENKERIY